MGRQPKAKKIFKMGFDDYTTIGYTLILAPTKEQRSTIIDLCEVTNRIHVWLHDSLLAPAHKNHVERTSRFCDGELRYLINNRYDRDVSEEDKEIISKYGTDGFGGICKLAAYEHSKLPFGVERYNEWVHLNEEDKMCMFLTPIANQFETSPNTGFSVIVHDDGLMYVDTHELGRVRISAKSTERVESIFNHINKSPGHFYLYPQVLFDRITEECMLRVVLALYDDHPAENITFNQLEAYRECPFVKVPEEFFSDFRGYLYWPSP